MSKQVSQQSMPANKFKEAVEHTPDIAQGYNKGLQAIDARDRLYFKICDPKLLDGSVNIDKMTQHLYPRDNRWDYAVGYRSKVSYVEVHPASTANVAEMIKKLLWLKSWLKCKAPFLNELPAATPRFYWVATSAGVHISKSSTQYKQLAQMGLIPQKMMEFK